MSRIGKTIRKIPNNVTLEVKDGIIKVKGPKGELTQNLHPLVNIEIKENQATVSVKNENVKLERSLWGTYSALLNNMIVGVSEGFSRKLEVNGVGYKVVLNGKDLNLEVGYSYPILFTAPEGIDFAIEKNVITVSGIDKQKVGETTANIRKIRKPEPYKGKGIKYLEEVIRRKVGKTAAKAE